MNGRCAGFAVNALLRVSIAGFLMDVLRHPRDPRYAGKAIPLRNLIVFGTLGHVFPALSVAARYSPRVPQWRRYPVWTDNLYLSIYWLDMAGNAFDLYDRFTHFDLIPHCHGTGAFAVVGLSGFGWSSARASAIATIVHLALETQENLTDLLCGTHNVRGAWDTLGDVGAGGAGTLLYVGGARLLRRLRESRRM